MAKVEKKSGEGKVLHEKIKGIRVAMLTSVDKTSGELHSRPMITEEEPSEEAELWFLTRGDAPKVGEAEQHPVNISYAEPSKNRFISVSGVAEVVRDSKKIEKMWKAEHNVWFPQGKDDPALALLKITVTRAEYWDGPSNQMLQIFQAAKAWATGDETLEKNQKLDLQ